MSYKIRISGIANMFEVINGGMDDIKQSLPKKYKEAVDQITKRFADSACGYLGKPKWLLADAIRAKTKIYREGRFFFGIAEILGKPPTKPNTPGSYGWYQEHGYNVSLGTVKRPKSKKTITMLYKKKRSIAVYRRQEPKRFFEKSFFQHKNELAEMIKKIHRELNIPNHPGRN